MSQTVLAPIQGLRAVAALSVSIVHFNTLWLILLGRGSEPMILHPLASGVDIFFVISGFIMVYSTERLFGQAHAPLVFLAKRLARIVPLYWLTMSIAILVQQTPIDPITLIKSYLFIPFATPDGEMHPIYGIGWTLEFEIFFYLIFAAMLRFNRTVAVLACTGLLLGVVLIGQLVEPTNVPLYFWSDPIILEFSFGMALALLYRRGIRLPSALCVGMLAVGVGAVWWSVPGMPPSGLRVVTCGIPAALIVAGAMFHRGERRPVRHGLLDLLGDASYSIYLIHPLVVAAIIRLWSFGLNAYPMWLVLLSGATLTLALSIASFYVFERPTTRAIQQVLITLATRALATAGVVARSSGGVMRSAAAERRPTWSVPTNGPGVHVPAIASRESRRR